MSGWCICWHICLIMTAANVWAAIAMSIMIFLYRTQAIIATKFWQNWNIWLIAMIHIGCIRWCRTVIVIAIWWILRNNNVLFRKKKIIFWNEPNLYTYLSPSCKLMDSRNWSGKCISKWWKIHFVEFVYFSWSSFKSIVKTYCITSYVGTVNMNKFKDENHAYQLYSNLR